MSPTTARGFFIRPTILVGTDPTHDVFTTEYFQPILGVFVYDDADFAAVVGEAGRGSAVRVDRGGLRPGPRPSGPGK